MEERKIKVFLTTRNAHDPELVRKVNCIANDPACVESFKLILCSLAIRDAEEVLEKVGIAIVDSEKAWEYAEELLELVCDDNDLEIIINFCNPQMDKRRQEIIDELSMIVSKNGGFINFDDEDFTFVGDDGSDVSRFVCDSTLVSMVILNGTLHIEDKFDGETFDNFMSYVPDFELERLLEYVKQKTYKQFKIRASAYFSRDFEVEANSYEEAVEKAKAELKANPWEEADNNGTEFN